MDVHRNQSRVQVFSLGRFAVYRDDEALELSGGMSKTWNLFKYLLTHRGQGVAADVLCEVFWPGMKPPRAQHALHNCVYRLKCLLEERRTAYKRSSFISTKDGMYILTSDNILWHDAEEFSHLCQKAHQLRKIYSPEAKAFFQQAVKLYRGDYLVENFYDDWVKPMQNRYRNQFLKAILDYSDLLIEDGDYADARAVCEPALELEPLEEQLYIRVLRAHVKEGNWRQAKEVYENVSALLYKETGLKPCEEMRRLYQSVGQSATHRAAADLESIKELLEQREESGGAFFCNTQSFQLLYSLERKRMSRTGISAFLVKLDLTNPDLSIPDPAAVERDATILAEALKRTLRKGDVVCQWNESQFLIILSGLLLTDVRHVVGRVSAEYQRKSSSDLTIRVRQSAIRPEEE